MNIVWASSNKAPFFPQGATCALEEDTAFSKCMSAASLKRNHFVPRAVTKAMGRGGGEGVDDGECAAAEDVTASGGVGAWEGVLSHVAMKGPR